MFFAISRKLFFTMHTMIFFTSNWNSNVLLTTLVFCENWIPLKIAFVVLGGICGFVFFSLDCESYCHALKVRKYWFSVRKPIVVARYSSQFVHSIIECRCYMENVSLGLSKSRLFGKCERFEFGMCACFRMVLFSRGAIEPIDDVPLLYEPPRR